ncbi:MAG: hypothetical protein D6808_03635 [Candidatus Dadabacteria bacterium]|nr:MAG: hypothetical protein D6808_03635 [Candidatus Dadabacteria bacterium]
MSQYDDRDEHKSGEYDRPLDPLEFADARISAKGSLAVANVNDYIAALYTYAQIALRSGELRLARIFNGKANMYAYLRDRQVTGEPKTVLEVLEPIRSRSIKPEIVKFWIEEGWLQDRLELRAVAKGYPEFKELSEDVAFGSVEEDEM